MPRLQGLPISERILIVLKERGPMTYVQIARALQISLARVRRAINRLRLEDKQISRRRIYVSRLSIDESRGGGATRTWAYGDLPDATEVEIIPRKRDESGNASEVGWLEQQREEARQENERLLSAQLRAIATAPGNPFAGLIWQATQ